MYDLEFSLEEGGKRNKLVFYHWYVVFNQCYVLPVQRERTFCFCSTPCSFLCLFSNVCVCDNDASRLRLRVRSPDTAKVKDKMVYASSRDALRRSFQGIAVEIQGTDFSEVAHETGAFVIRLLTPPFAPRRPISPFSPFFPSQSWIKRQSAEYEYLPPVHCTLARPRPRPMS